MDEKIKIPEQVAFILTTLEQHGYEGYAVGGCVRDTILGREPGDWDITTSAQPEQVKALFRRTVDTGILHGTVTVLLGEKGYEVTTYRLDGEYEDHRHPNKVEFTPDLTEDLRRRDFTINAMAYNPKSGMVDKFDGTGDIRRECIRCVGEAKERFEEDALRMLRGIRFAGQLLFTIEPRTLAAMEEKASLLVNVSAERIRTELTKLLLSEGADRLLLAVKTGLSRYFLPELDAMLATRQNNPHHSFDVGNHSIQAILHINKLWRENRELGEKAHIALVYSALLHDVAKPECLTTDEKGMDHFYHHNEMGAEKAKKILRRLKFDNETISMVGRLIYFHDRRHENCLVNGIYSEKGKKAMRRLINQIGADAMPLLFLLQRADLLAQSDYKREEKLAKLAAGERCYKEIMAAGEAVTIKDLAVGGKQIIELGVKPGPEIGRVLKELLEAVLEAPEKNTEEFLLKMASEIIKR
ncbi:MAG: CCA tRNA nucleotidyltransferase [Lachnospiraceae bacterium]|nr:CCA tRNA nucleotidyltransferase [Lachnospiraceae bacterium]